MAKRRLVGYSELMKEITLPVFPLIARLLPAKGGTYRVKAEKIQRLLFGRIWATMATCNSQAEAARITRELNAL